jgi:hypothetical protein
MNLKFEPIGLEKQKAYLALLSKQPMGLGRRIRSSLGLAGWSGLD